MTIGPEPPMEVRPLSADLIALAPTEEAIEEADDAEVAVVDGDALLLLLLLTTAPLAGQVRLYSG